MKTYNVFNRTTKFIQIIADNKKFSLKNIKNGITVHTAEYDISRLDPLFFYLSAYSKIPVEIIVQNDRTTAKSVNSNNMSNAEVGNMLHNSMHFENCNFNTIFYRKHRKHITICETNFDGIMSSAFDKLLSISNTINSISCWPIWVIDKYYSIFAEDSLKFNCSLFTINNGTTCDFVAVNKNLEIICHRQLDPVNMDENEETIKTMRYIERTCDGIKADDIAIYSLNKDTIDTFVTQSSSINMNFVSNVVLSKFGVMSDCLKQTKLAIKSLCILCSVGIAYQAFTITSLNSQISNFDNINKSVDQSIINERPLWESNSAHYSAEQINFYGIIGDILKCYREETIEDLDINIIDNNNVDVTIQLLNGNSKHNDQTVVTSEFEFKITKSQLDEDNCLICNGKRINPI